MRLGSVDWVSTKNRLIQQSKPFPHVDSLLCGWVQMSIFDNQ